MQNEQQLAQRLYRAINRIQNSKRTSITSSGGTLNIEKDGRTNSIDIYGSTTLRQNSTNRG